MKQLILDLIPPPAPTLENFVPGRNAEALQALLDAASKVLAVRFFHFSLA